MVAIWSLVLSLLLSTFAFADQAPVCLSYGKNLAVNNSQVLHWKRTTNNQFRERGHVQGTVLQVYNDKNGHSHFQVQLGNQGDDTIEVIYNQDFGVLPAVHSGMNAEACGDYITSTAQSGPYPASPDGAILHWVHMNPSGRGHDAGYLMLDGTLYGQDAEHAGDKHQGSDGSRDALPQKQKNQDNNYHRRHR